MNTKCYSIVAVLVLIIAAMSYKFIFQGAVTQTSDGRTAIHLTVDERNFVLREMREFLISVQQISKGISDNDMQRVVEYARQSGRSAQQSVPATLAGKLPLAFKRQGFDTHSQFDQLALDANDLGDSTHALAQLSVLMENCVSCHAVYKIDTPNY